MAGRKRRQPVAKPVQPAGDGLPASPTTGSQSYFGGSGGHDIYRSVIIGDAIYTVSQDEVMASDLTSFSTLATATLG